MRDRLTRRKFAGVTTATLTGVVSLSGCLGGGGDDDGGPPDISVSIDADTDASEITVTHDGGDQLLAENASVIQIRLETEDVEDSVLLGEWRPPIEEGDSTTVQGSIESGNTVIVRWISPDQQEFSDITTQEIG